MYQQTAKIDATFEKYLPWCSWCSFFCPACLCVCLLHDIQKRGISSLLSALSPLSLSYEVGTSLCHGRGEGQGLGISRYLECVESVWKTVEVSQVMPTLRQRLVQMQSMLHVLLWRVGQDEGRSNICRSLPLSSLSTRTASRFKMTTEQTYDSWSDWSPRRNTSRDVDSLLWSR